MRLEDLIRSGHAGMPAGEGPSDAFGRGPGAHLTGRTCFGIRRRLRGQGAVAEFMAGAASVFATLPMVFFGESGFGEAHELIEDGELKLQLDGVDHGFDRCFAHVIVGEFQANEDDVHADADAVDQEKLQHHFTRHAVVDGSQQPDGRHDIDCRDGEFLNAKAEKLDAFHDVELGCPILRLWRVTPIRKDDCRDMQGAGIKNDHPEHDSKRSLVADDKVKARVEHKGLPRNHCNPS